MQKRPVLARRGKQHLRIAVSLFDGQSSHGGGGGALSRFLRGSPMTTSARPCGFLISKRQNPQLFHSTRCCGQCHNEEGDIISMTWCTLRKPFEEKGAKEDVSSVTVRVRVKDDGIHDSLVVHQLVTLVIGKGV